MWCAPRCLPARHARNHNHRLCQTLDRTDVRKPSSHPFSYRSSATSTARTHPLSPQPLRSLHAKRGPPSPSLVALEVLVVRPPPADGRGWSRFMRKVAGHDYPLALPSPCIQLPFSMHNAHVTGWRSRQSGSAIPYTIPSVPPPIRAVFLLPRVKGVRYGQIFSYAP